jgi:peroxiredoxin
MDPRQHLPMNQIPPLRHKGAAPWKAFAFVAGLFALGFVYLGWVLFRPAPHTKPGTDLAGEVRAYLRERGVRPLSEPLQKLLSDAAGHDVPTQPHPLLGKKAPDFELEDPHGDKHTLRSYLNRGPVVLVFYYGYYCNHCVSQLFALDKDWPYFHELGAEVVALSPDPPADTRQRFRRYGEFKFPVLSDPKNAVAQCYGVFQPAESGKAENLDHATFVIDRDGTVRWAQRGDEPFTDDLALIREVARLTRPQDAAAKK